MTEPICDDVAASSISMLQLQLGVSNTSLEGPLLHMSTVKSWTSFLQIINQGQEVHLPLWATIVGLVLLGALLFYLVNYMLWAQREKAQRLHDLEDAKKHSEHGNMLGSLIEAAIEHFDEQLLGVNVDFGAVKVTVGEGVVAVHDLTLENPSGYWSPYFVHIGELLVDIDLQTFMTSMGRHVVIERLQLHDVDIIWEGSIFSSNLRDFLKLLKGTGAKTRTAQPGQASHDGVQTTVQEVVAEGMTLKLASYMLCGCGPRVMAEDFETSNFSAENRTLDVPELLVVNLLWSVLASVLGRDVARTLTEGTSHWLTFLSHCFWHLVAICGYALSCCGRARARPEPKAARAPRKSKSTKDPAPASCGNCGSCLPCEALLKRQSRTARPG